MLERQARSTSQDITREREEPQQTAPSIAEYPLSVNSRLYEVLHDKRRCTCLEPASSLLERHQGRLRLRCSWQAAEDNVAFDMLLSGKPHFMSEPSTFESHQDSQRAAAAICWQQVRIYVPRYVQSLDRFHLSQHRIVTLMIPQLPRRRDADAKRGKIVDNSETAPSITIQTSAPVEVSDICKLLGMSIGSAVIPLIFRNRKIYQRKAEPVEARVTPEPSVSLNVALERQPQSSKDRMILAYILAKSVWQYYQCEWIMSRWGAESIHFIKERLPGSQAATDGYFNLTAPYFALKDLEGVKCQTTQEYADSVLLVHNYPWLMALGILLVDACRNRKGKGNIDPGSTHTTSDIAGMNEEYARYWQIVRQDETWPCLNLQNQEVALEYKKVVECCLDRDIFIDAPTIEERRAVILNRIVHPLHCLLVKLGWLDEHGAIICNKPRPSRRHYTVERGHLFSMAGIFDASATLNSGERQASFFFFLDALYVVARSTC